MEDCIAGYEAVSVAKINQEKLVGLLLGIWRGKSISSSVEWTDGPVKLLGVWVSSDNQKELGASLRPRRRLFLGLGPERRYL